MDDLIYRQVAIDAIRASTSKYTGFMEMEMYTDDDAVEAIKDLPSAQPEIIRCKDCKHFEYDHTYIIQGMPILGHEVCNAWGDGCKTDENGYCFMAEWRIKDEK